MTGPIRPPLPPPPPGTRPAAAPQVGAIPQEVHGGNNTSTVYRTHPEAPSSPLEENMEKHTPFLEGWRFALAIGTMLVVPITVTVWLMSYHEQRPHQESVTKEAYKDFRDEMKEDIKDIKRTQQDTALEMAKQSRAIVEFVNLQERRSRPRRPTR